MELNVDTSAEGRTSCHGKVEKRAVEEVPRAIEAVGYTKDPEVVVLACRWRYFAGSDLEGLKRLASEVDYSVVRAPCSGQLSGDWVAAALESGADAVMVLGGHPTCRFSHDRAEAEGGLKDRVARDGLDPEKVVVDWRNGASPDGMERSVDQVIAAVRSSQALGPDSWENEDK